MNCCGNKRRAWLTWLREKSSGSGDQGNPGSSMKSPANQKVFELTGSGPKSFRGAVTGKVYRFDFRGQKVTVAYADSFAMMAEREIRPIAPERSSLS